MSQKINYVQVVANGVYNSTLKWKTERNKLLSELSFCSEHKFNLEAELIRHKIELLGSFIFDLEYCLK